jgi:diguanylate cyclase (GGDEF)-like protein
MLADGIRLAVQNHDWPAVNENLKVTVSIGIADQTLAHDVASLISAADEALYRAKAQGRNRVIKG